MPNDPSFSDHLTADAHDHVPPSATPVPSHVVDHIHAEAERISAALAAGTLYGYPLMALSSIDPQLGAEATLVAAYAMGQREIQERPFAGRGFLP